MAIDTDVIFASYRWLAARRSFCANLQGINVNRSDRAAQIWPLLTYAASNRQSLTYDLLGKLIGVPRQGLGQLLEPIQSYCILQSYPALSSLVVGQNTGSPGEGFIAAADVPAEQAAVFSKAWLERSPPTPEELEAAVRKLPSNGRPLAELKAQAANAS